jgi:hypothetical protein
MNVAGIVFIGSMILLCLVAMFISWRLERKSNKVVGWTQIKNEVEEIKRYDIIRGPKD